MCARYRMSGAPAFHRRRIQRRGLALISSWTWSYRRSGFPEITAASVGTPRGGHQRGEADVNERRQAPDLRPGPRDRYDLLQQYRSRRRMPAGRGHEPARSAVPDHRRRSAITGPFHSMLSGLFPMRSSYSAKTRPPIFAHVQWCQGSVFLFGLNCTVGAVCAEPPRRLAGATRQRAARKSAPSGWRCCRLRRH